MRILSIDPGVATGLASYNTATEGFSSEEVVGQIEACNWISSFVHPKDVDHLVIENYIINGGTMKKTFQPASLEIIGVVRWLCAMRGVPLTVQPPSERLGMTNDVLKTLGWYKGTKGVFEGHADQAARHLGAFLMSKQDQKFLRRVYA